MNKKSFSNSQHNSNNHNNKPGSYEVGQRVNLFQDDFSHVTSQFPSDEAAPYPGMEIERKNFQVSQTENYKIIGILRID